jgi:hypothetical protein
VVIRIDPHNFGIIARIPVGGDLYPIAVGDDGVWVGTWTQGVASELVEIDPASNAVMRRISTEPLSLSRPACCIHDLAVGKGAAWMLFGDNNQLVRVDAETGDMEWLGAYGSELALGEKALWVLGRTSRQRDTPNRVLRIDPLTKKPAADLTGTAGEIAIGGGWVWLAKTSSDPNDRLVTILRIDPATNEASTFTTVRAGPAKVNFECGGCGWRVGIAYGLGSVWLTVTDALELIRIEPPEFTAT